MSSCFGVSPLPFTPSLHAGRMGSSPSRPAPPPVTAEEVKQMILTNSNVMPSAPPAPDVSSATPAEKEAFIKTHKLTGNIERDISDLNNQASRLATDLKTAKDAVRTAMEAAQKVKDKYNELEPAAKAEKAKDGGHRNAVLVNDFDELDHDFKIKCMKIVNMKAHQTAVEAHIYVIERAVSSLKILKESSDFSAHLASGDLTSIRTAYEHMNVTNSEEWEASSAVAAAQSIGTSSSSENIGGANYSSGAGW